jgi:amino acid transporter
VFAWIKVLALIGLVIFGLIANLGGVPTNREFIGGRYWRAEPFNDNFMGVQPVSKSRFLGFWAVLTRAAFSYGGVEAVAVVAGEAFNPRRSIRLATRAVFYRVVGIYILTML